MTNASALCLLVAPQILTSLAWHWEVKGHGLSQHEMWYSVAGCIPLIATLRVLYELLHIWSLYGRLSTLRALQTTRACFRLLIKAGWAALLTALYFEVVPLLCPSPCLGGLSLCHNP